MKKIAFSFLLFITFAGYSQIGTAEKVAPAKTIGKVAPLGTFIAEITVAANPADEKDTTYTLHYRNYALRRITDIRSISYSGIGGAHEDLYKLLKSVFSDENKSNKDYAVNVTIGEKLVQIGNHREMGTTMVRWLVGGNDYGILTEKQLDKLFNK